MSIPTVHILVTVNNPNLADLSTLVFKTLRVGFPTARVLIYANNAAALAALKSVGIEADVYYPCTKHHARWISDILHSATGPTVILDPDVLFWSSVESWAFDASCLMAGHYIPRIWNEWAGCPSVPRLHTALLWLPDPVALRIALRITYPYADEPLGEYCPCDPWMPAVRFDRGQATFWDTAANAYNMIPHSCRGFNATMLNCYTHVNSPTFHDVFIHRTADPGAYSNVLSLALREPDRLRGFWQAEDMYYEEMARKLNT